MNDFLMLHCADMDTCSVDGLQGGNQSTWKLCLNLKCCTPSHRSFAYLLVNKNIFYELIGYRWVQKSETICEMLN